MSTTTAVAPPAPLDECDLGSCSARALVAMETSHGRLVFCGHDWDQKIKPHINDTVTFNDTRETNK